MTLSEPKVSIIGGKFGKWTVVEFAGRDAGGRARWLCVCTCGNQKERDGYSLTSGGSHTCSDCGTRKASDSTRLTRREFVAQAIKLHGKYSYDKVVYVNNNTKVVITCPDHGDFPQVPFSHLRGSGCPQCGIDQRGDARSLSQEDFITQARSVHGEKYQYDNTIYVRGKQKVVITCPDHGDFEQEASCHLLGGGCAKCSSIRIADSHRDTQKEWLVKAREVHGLKYFYDKVVYIHTKVKVIISCPDHGDFQQTPNAHVAGGGCMKCAILSRSQNRRLSVKEFIAKARAIHDNKYSYDKVAYVGCRTDVLITCPKSKHGEFSQKPVNHLSGSGCPKCSESRGEKYVAKTLRQFAVEFDREFSLPDCRYKKPLFFDFCVWGKDGFPSMVEFQGLQHYTGWTGGEGFATIQHRDAIKAAFCKRMNIPLLVIPYWDECRIPELVGEFLNVRAIGATA